MNMDNSDTKIKVTVTRDSDTLGPAGESRCTSHRSLSTSKIKHQKCEVAAPQQKQRALSTARRISGALLPQKVQIDDAATQNHKKSLSNTDKLNRHPQETANRAGKLRTGCIKNSFTTEKIVEYFYEPQYTDLHNGVNMLCSRVNINNRYVAIG